MRRRRRSMHDLGATGEDFNSTSIFITPMLDMTFQLLTFFIFTYNPSALEGQFPISLASGQEAGPKKSEPTNTPAGPTLTRPNVTVIAKARDKGRLSSIEVLVAGGAKETIKPPEGQDESVEMLLAHLEVKLLDCRQDDDRLIFQASQGMRWDDAMLAIDSCRQTTQLARLQKEGKLKTYFPDLKLAGRTKLFAKIEMDLIRN